jgi:XTP/dITP diphosphohydrolase
MKELVIASNNQGKIKEIKAIIHHDIQLHSLEHIGFSKEIPEPFHTFEENAFTKAKTVFDFCKKNTFADDSGLCVAALQNEPGVQSAYYGGLPRSDEKNNLRLLSALAQHTDRTAFYQCVICLIWEGTTYYFDGVCEGHIALQPTGDKGFGYDPLFIPKGYNESFGTLPLGVKNELSHRGKAVKKMVTFINNQLSKK